MTTLATKRLPINNLYKKSFLAHAKPTAGFVTLTVRSDNNELIRRKQECPCGGGCPSCKKELGIQTKFKINEPGDRYEQEADRIADQVMRITDQQALGLSRTDTNIQRKCVGCSSGKSPCPQCAEQEEIQRKPIAETITPLIQRQREELDEEEEELLRAKKMPGQTPQISPSLGNQINSFTGGGQPLPGFVGSYFEPRFGCDFSEVRVHTDSLAAEAAKTLNARAFTVGRDVVFGAGEYAPRNSQGQQLMAHELTHVVQQGASQNLVSKASPQTIQRAPAVDDETLCELAEFPPAAVWFTDPVLTRIRVDEALMALGSVGETVALMQQAVVAWGCDEGLGHLLPKFGVDGIFGSETRAAVKTFQGRQGIVDDGIVGPITMGELDGLIGDAITQRAVEEIDAPATVAPGSQVLIRALTHDHSPAAVPVRWTLEEAPLGTTLPDTGLHVTLLSAPQVGGTVVLSARNSPGGGSAQGSITVTQIPTSSSCKPQGSKPANLLAEPLGGLFNQVQFPLHTPHCGPELTVKADPSGAKPCWSLEQVKGGPPIATGTTINPTQAADNQSEIKVGKGQKVGDIKVLAQGHGTANRTLNMPIRSHPTGISSTTVIVKPPSSTDYLANFNHTFDSQVGNQGSLKGVHLIETFSSQAKGVIEEGGKTTDKSFTLKTATPKSGSAKSTSVQKSPIGPGQFEFEHQRMDKDALKTETFVLNAAGQFGSITEGDSLSTLHTAVDIQRALLHAGRTNKVKFPFKAAIEVTQNLHWYCRLDMKTQPWSKFVSLQHVRELVIEKPGKNAKVSIGVETKTSDFKLIHPYKGAHAVFNVEVEPNDPKVNTTAQIKAETSDTSGLKALEFSILPTPKIGASDTTIHPDTGKLTIGKEPGTIGVRVTVKATKGTGKKENFVPIEVKIE